MMSDTDQATVLVVDDEKEVADAYALRLQEMYETRTAYSGKNALEQLDETVDVVLLDRRMPEMSGDEVLRKIQEKDKDYRVIMLTAIDPEFDILDMPFDDYLCKPVDRNDLHAAIDQQLRIVTCDHLSEYFELASKQSVLEAQLPSQELEHNEQYTELESRVSELQTELARTLDEFEEIEQTFKRIDRRPI